MKSFLRIACTCFGFAFFGCSGESTNDGSDDSEYFIAEVGSYKLEQNALLFTQGLCEAKDGKLVWSKSGESSRFPAQFDESNGTLRLSFNNGDVQFGYIGNSFPIGVFRGQSVALGKIDGVVLEKDSVLKFVLFKKDNCFFEDYDFPLSGDEKRIDCNTAEDNGVLRKFLPFEGNSMKSIVSVGKASCNIEFKRRYPYYEQDCKDAYNDFLKDSSAAKTFDFENYDIQVIQDEECMKDLKIELFAKKVREE